MPKKKKKIAPVPVSTPVEKVEEVVSEEVKVPEIASDTPLKVETAPLETNQISQDEIPIERKNRILYFLGIVFLTAVLTATVIIYFFYKSDKKNQATPVVIESLSPSPVPTEIVAFQPSEWFLEVQNGSGRGGVAKKAADSLSALGFRIISVGNADNSNYKNVAVYISAGKSSFEKEFMDKIKSIYQTASVSGILTSSTASARIIIGR